jgi:hypothetical protein
MNKFLPFLLMTILLGTLSQCSKSSGGGTSNNNNLTVDCSTVTNKAFAADVNPIFQSTCSAAGCHASGSVNGPGALTTYAQISAAKNQIRQVITAGTMPQNSTLSVAQRSSIICWIDSGAPNN